MSIDGQAASLHFEVFDCYDDDSDDTKQSAGELPIRSILKSVDFDVNKWKEVLSEAIGMRPL
jgi:hypothetical protein